MTRYRCSSHTRPRSEQKIMIIIEHDIIVETQVTQQSLFVSMHQLGDSNWERHHFDSIASYIPAWTASTPTPFTQSRLYETSGLPHSLQKSVWPWVAVPNLVIQLPRSVSLVAQSNENCDVATAKKQEITTIARMVLILSLIWYSVAMHDGNSLSWCPNSHAWTLPPCMIIVGSYQATFP